MVSRTVMVITAGIGLAAALPLIAQQRAASGPVARYDMRAGTISGFGGMGGGGMMAAMMGGGRGNSTQHELWLRLGSSRTPDKGNPKADHFMPPVAKLGKSVALMTPQQERSIEELPQRPKGRLLIFWGCGDHVPKGQPVVIDFAKIAAGQVPPGLWTSTIIRDWGPSLTNSRTFGRWPHGDDPPGTGKYLKSDSSLLGPHRVAGNYTPEMAFTLTKDFMAPLSLRTSVLPQGSIQVSWGGIPNATAYLLGLFGGKMGPGGEMGDMVMWTSSTTRQFGGGLMDWLSPGQVAPLVQNRTLLAPAVTSCSVPAEVKAAAPDFRVGTLTAFGPQEDFAYPPRPADARTPWNLEWTARIRHRSTSMWMEAQGMSMGAGNSGSSADPAQPGCRPRRGLGGMLGGALGGGC